jgi:hypothetical protein
MGLLRGGSMFRKFRDHLTYANVMATLACFGVLAGGTAYAADTVLSGDIKDGEVMTQDLANLAVTAGKLANSSVGKNKVAGNAIDSPRVVDSSLTGTDVAADSLTGADVNESTLTGTGPRAYGRVTKGGVITNSKGVVGNATGGTGIYCITLAPSIDASTAQVVATPNLADDDTSGLNGTQAVVEWNSAPISPCTGNVVQVVTFEEVLDPPGVVVANEGFAFVVP